MKLGQNVRKPSLFELKEKYSGYFDLIAKILNDDEELKNVFENTLLYLEWNSLFLERINEEAGGKLSKNEQEREYRRFKKEVADTTLKMQTYFIEWAYIKLPEDKSTIIKELQDELIRCDKDTKQTDELIEQIKELFEIKRIKANNRYKNNEANKEIMEIIKENLHN